MEGKKSNSHYVPRDEPPGGKIEAEHETTNAEHTAFCPGCMMILRLRNAKMCDRWIIFGKIFWGGG